MADLEKAVHALRDTLPDAFARDFQLSTPAEFARDVLAFLDE